MEHKHLQVFAYVIMSNHIHLVAQSAVGQLSNTIRDIKKYTSKRIIDTIYAIPESRREWMVNRFQFNAQKHKRNSKFQVWTHENHAIYLYSTNFICEKNRIHPKQSCKALIVQNPEDYLYSSARNYACIPAILNIEPLSLPWITY